VFEIGKLFLKKHSSFVVIATAALCFFIANYYFEKILSPEDYGAYSIFITYIGTIYSFGLLGLEQTILRLIESKNNEKIGLSKYFFISLLTIGFILSLIGSILVKKLAFSDYDEISMYRILVISYMLVLSMLTYNLLRLRNLFVKSQLTTNIWKFFLLIVALVFTGTSFWDFSFFFKTFFWFSVVWFFVLISILLKSIAWSEKREDIKKIRAYWGHFFIAIISITALLFIDRYIVQIKLGKIEFGRYFYIGSIFLFPFGLFQNYFGFKQLVKYKLNFSLKIFRNDIKQVLLFTGMLIVFLMTFAFFASNSSLVSIDLKCDYPLILAFLILGSIRTIYSIISAAVGAIIEIKRFRILNAQSIITLLLLSALLFYIGNTKESIVYIVTLMWITRCLIYLRSILKNTKFKN